MNYKYIKTTITRDDKAMSTFSHLATLCKVLKTNLLAVNFGLLAESLHNSVASFTPH